MKNRGLHKKYEIFLAKDGKRLSHNETAKWVKPVTKLPKNFSRLMVMTTLATLGFGSFFSVLYVFLKRVKVIFSVVITSISQTKVFGSVLYKMEFAK